MVIYTLPVAIPALNELSNADIRGGRFWEKMKSKVILEANYRNPSFTPERIRNIRKANSKVVFIDGKIWLLYQAVTGYEIMTGDYPDIDAMEKVMK